MSQQDLYLVIGILVCGFSVPAVLGAMADRRSPWVALVIIAIGGFLVILALSQQTYPLEDIPEAFVRVLAHFIR